MKLQTNLLHAVKNKNNGVLENIPIGTDDTLHNCKIMLNKKMLIPVIGIFVRHYESIVNAYSTDLEIKHIRKKYTDRVLLIQPLFGSANGGIYFRPKVSSSLSSFNYSNSSVVFKVKDPIVKGIDEIHSMRESKYGTSLIHIYIPFSLDLTAIDALNQSYDLLLMYFKFNNIEYII